MGRQTVVPRKRAHPPLFNIGLPHEQEPNAYSTPDLTFQFHYFAVRNSLRCRANALVAFLVGGTLDELSSC
jgi:predicted Rossmann-fold nucleotide-binding protein